MSTNLATVPCVAGREFVFAPDKAALLLIDMQKDFLAPGGLCDSLGEDIAAMRPIIPRIQRLLAGLRGAGVRAIHTREGYAPDLSDVNPLKRSRSIVGRPGPLGRLLIRGEPGHDFIDELRPEPGERVVDKPGFGAFFRTDLEEHLRAAGITHLLIAGVTSQCCIQSSLREAVDRGFFCLTLADCCAAVEPQLHEATLTAIQGENHLFGWIATADAVLVALAGQATVGA
jgi:nicotinamidase-related amidase